MYSVPEYVGSATGAVVGAAVGAVVGAAVGSGPPVQPANIAVARSTSPANKNVFLMLFSSYFSFFLYTYNGFQHINTIALIGARPHLQLFL
jgi:hypothetical protein